MVVHEFYRFLPVSTITILKEHGVDLNHPPLPSVTFRAVRKSLADELLGIPGIGRSKAFMLFERAVGGTPGWTSLLTTIQSWNTLYDDARNNPTVLKRLRPFRSEFEYAIGLRNAPINQRALTDEDIRNIRIYFSGLSHQGGLPDHTV